MNRRHFLKGTGTALLGAATVGLAVRPEEPKAVYEELPLDNYRYDIGGRNGNITIQQYAGWMPTPSRSS